MTGGSVPPRFREGLVFLCAVAVTVSLTWQGRAGGAESTPDKAIEEPSRAYAGMTISREAPGGNRFLGSKACAGCHEDYYRGWKKTFHSTVIQDARANPEAILADFSEEGLPFTRQEVEYTIGSHWDQRYMKRMGDEYYVLPRLWSVQSKEWRPYSVWSWKRKPYSQYCAGCHTTYINPGEKTIAEEGIGCEACHGPGGLHVDEGGSPERIVNPDKLDKYLSNMICASCHVRGQDLTGKYYYPVGYIPGSDLSENYVPLEKEEGESNRAALKRLFGEWKDKMLNASRAKCEVCGIGGQENNTAKDNKQSDMEFCFSCHNFRARMQLHTNHPGDIDLVCYDCHVKQAEDISKGLTGSIHSYSYFLVHTENCYDPEIEKACVSCHDGKKESLQWAQDIIKSWRRPVIIGH